MANHLFLWWAREGSNLQPDGYEPSGRKMHFGDNLLTHILLVVTQIDTHARPDSARARTNTLIGLVAEDRSIHSPPTVFALYL